MHQELKSHSPSSERAAKASGPLPILIILDLFGNQGHAQIHGTWNLAEHQAAGIFAAKTLSAGTRMTTTTTTGGSYAKQT